MADQAEKIVAATLALRKALNGAGIELKSIELAGSEDVHRLHSILVASASFAAAWTVYAEGDRKTSISGVPFVATRRTFTPMLLRKPE